MQQQRQGNSNRTMRAHTVLQSWHKLSFKRTVSTSLIGPLSSRLKSVWAFVKRAGETCAQKPVSISDPAKTWESTGRKWQNIPQMTIRSVCQSMIRLLRAVIKAKKYRTWYQWPKPHFDVTLLTSISIIASFLIKAYGSLFTRKWYRKVSCIAFLKPVSIFYKKLEMAQRQKFKNDARPWTNTDSKGSPVWLRWPKIELNVYFALLPYTGEVNKTLNINLCIMYRYSSILTNVCKSGLLYLFLLSWILSKEWIITWIVLVSPDMNAQKHCMDLFFVHTGMTLGWSREQLKGLLSGNTLDTFTLTYIYPVFCAFLSLQEIHAMNFN